MDKERSEKNELVLIAAQFEAICDILEGLEVSDFMGSFPIVRQVAELYAASQPAVQADAEELSFCPKCGARFSSLAFCKCTERTA